MEGANRMSVTGGGKGRGMKRFLVKIASLLIAVLPMAKNVWSECSDDSCPELVRESLIPGTVEWTCNPDTGELEPSATDAIESCQWEDPCEGCTEYSVNEPVAVPYALLSDEVVTPDPDDRSTWYRWVTYKAESTCGGSRSIITSTNYELCDCRTSCAVVPSTIRLQFNGGKEGDESSHEA